MNIRVQVQGLDAVNSKFQQTATVVESSAKRMSSGLYLTTGAMNELETAGVKVQSAGPNVNSLTPHVERASHSAREAKEAFAGMGEELGVHMPRFVRGFLTSIGPVSGLMAAAFAPIAIIGLIDYLAKIPEAIEKGTDSIMGFGEKQKEAFAADIKASTEAQSAFKNLEAGQTALADTSRRLGREQDSFNDRLGESSKKAEEQTSALWYIFPPLRGLIVTYRELADATTGAADREAALIEVQRKQLEESAKQGAERVQDGYKAQEEALKIAMIGDKGYAHVRGELKLLGVEEEAEIARRHAGVSLSEKEIGLIREKYDLQREAVLKTAAEEFKPDETAEATAKVTVKKTVELEQVNSRKEAADATRKVITAQNNAEIQDAQDVEAEKYRVALDGLKQRQAEIEKHPTENSIDAAKAVNDEIEALEAAHIQRTAQISARSVELDRSAFAAGIDIARNAETEKFKIEEKALQDHVKILQAKQGREGKSEAPEIATTNGEIQSLQIAHAARMQAIDAQVALHEIQSQQQVAAASRQTAEEQERVAREVAARKEQAVELVMRIDQNAIESAGLDANKSLQLANAADDERLRTHQISVKEWADVGKQAVQQWYETQRAALQQAANDARTFFGLDSIEYKRMVDKLDALDKERQVKVTTINTKVQQDYEKTYQKIAQTVNSDLVSMITGHERAGEAIMRISDKMAQKLTSNLIDVAEQELVGLITSKEVAQTEQQLNAKKAAGNTYAEVSKIPVIGPYLAPVAAAAAYAAVLAFEGGGIVPAEGPAYLHAKEMVLPEHISTPLISMIDNGGLGAPAAAGPGPGGIAGKGHTFNQTNHFNGGDLDGIEKLLNGQSRNVLRYAHQLDRNNVRIGGRR